MMSQDLGGNQAAQIRSGAKSRFQEHLLYLGFTDLRVVQVKAEALVSKQGVL